jgi:hypothetical protein
MVVACVALAVALGGTSYAAFTVTSRDVRNNSLTGTDIRNNSVTTRDIRNGTLTRRDFRRGQLQRGPRGAAGPAGPAGPAGVSRWVLVNGAGEIEQQSGGFRVVSAYGSNGAAPAAAGNVYIELTGEDLTDNGLAATIALQNQVNQNGNLNGSNSADGAPGTMNGTNTGGDGSPPTQGDNLEFSGEISVARCNTAGLVGCQPPGANENDTFVVSPRLSDGQRTTAGNRKRFYVVVTG